MTSEQIAMRRAAIGVAFLGVAFAAASWGAVYLPAQFFLNLVHFPFNSAPEALGPTERLLIAISGGLTVGLAGMLWSVANFVMPQAPEAGRKVVIYSVMSWFVVDSMFSVVAGAPLNVIGNLVFVFLMLGSIKRSGLFKAMPDAA